MTPAPATLDTTPLTAPVDRAAARAFARRLRAEGRVSGTEGSVLVAAVLAVASGLMMLAVFGVIFASALRRLSAAGFGWLALVPVLIVITVVTVIVVGIIRGGGGSIRWYRLDRFARANGLSYEPRRASPPLPGMIFGRGSARRASDLVRGASPRFLEIANYRYATGSGKNRDVHRWGYVALKLDVPLPHIVLDATGNNGLFGSTNLPTAFDRDQRLSLEGDFDRYFSLYCPAGYEPDALYLFTPDIMARFVDNAAALDVEIVDDWLFLYAKRDLSTLDPATWAWLFAVVGALLDKLAQWGRWRDERLTKGQALDSPGADASPASALPVPAAPADAPLTPPPAGVAPQGRRLKRGISWVTIAALGLVAVWWIVNIALGSISP